MPGKDFISEAIHKMLATYNFVIYYNKGKALYIAQLWDWWREKNGSFHNIADNELDEDCLWAVV